MLRFLQIFFIITWVIDLYTMLQRLVALKKYGKAFTVNLPSQMLKEYNTAAMFVLFPIRDARFLSGSTQIDPVIFIPTIRKGGVVYFDTSGPWSTKGVRGNRYYTVFVD